jgi:hypothetical protein
MDKNIAHFTWRLKYITDVGDVIRYKIFQV